MPKAMTSELEILRRKKISETMKSKGLCPPNLKGHKWTKEQNEARSKKLQGHEYHGDYFKAALEHNEKNGLKHGFKRGETTGKRNINWKGGITPINQRIRHSKKYKLWREKVFKRDNYTCVKCSVSSTYLNADHIKQFSKYPKLRFDINNGRTLCVPCHRKTDTYGYKGR